MKLFLQQLCTNCSRAGTQARLVFAATNPATGPEQEYHRTSDYILIGQQHVTGGRDHLFVPQAT